MLINYINEIRKEKLIQLIKEQVDNKPLCQDFRSMKIPIAYVGNEKKDVELMPEEKYIRSLLFLLEMKIKGRFCSKLNYDELVLDIFNITNNYGSKDYFIVLEVY